MRFLHPRSIAAPMSAGERHPRSLGGVTSGPPEPGYGFLHAICDSDLSSFDSRSEFERDRDSDWAADARQELEDGES